MPLVTEKTVVMGSEIEAGLRGDDWADFLVRHLGPSADRSVLTTVFATSLDEVFNAKRHDDHQFWPSRRYPMVCVRGLSRKAGLAPFSVIGRLGCASVCQCGELTQAACGGEV